MTFISKHLAQIRFTLQLLLIAVSIAFVYLGVYRGEVETVFTKAIRLCLECVGIG